MLSTQWRLNISLRKMQAICGGGGKQSELRGNSGSFENEALENEDRSTKHPNLENEAPKSRKRSTQNSKTKHPRSKTKHPNLENEAPKTRKRSTLDRKRRPQNLENEAPKTRNHCRLYVLHDAIRIRWRQRMRPHLQRSTKSIPRFLFKSLPTV